MAGDVRMVAECKHCRRELSAYRRANVVTAMLRCRRCGEWAPAKPAPRDVVDIETDMVQPLFGEV